MKKIAPVRVCSVLQVLCSEQNFFAICLLTENIVSMNATQSETPFGSKVRKGMFRTVSQLYKVCREYLYLRN